MLAFGGSGFILAYADVDTPLFLQYIMGSIAILAYTVFYLVVFGRDEVKWMFINAAIGMYGIYCEIGTLLSYFDRSIFDYPLAVHVIPFVYWVLYTFLIRQAILDATHSRDDEIKRKRVEYGYIATSMAIYTFI